MTRDDIIRMALEAGFYWYDTMHVWTTPTEDCPYPEGVYKENLERFAALIAAEKEQQMTRDGWRKCAEGQNTTQFCGEAERLTAENERLNTHIKTLKESRNVALAEAYRCGWDGGVKREREECAKVCEEHPDGFNMMGGAFVTCANAIRARNEQ